MRITYSLQGGSDQASHLSYGENVGSSRQTAGISIIVSDRARNTVLLKNLGRRKR